MTVLNILSFPDPRLRLKAKPVVRLDDSVRHLVADMFDTMYAAGGIGLAATQIDVQRRVVVMDLGEEDENGGQRVFINPQVRPLPDAEPRKYREGCLSVPEFTKEIARPDAVDIHALDADGEPFAMRATGLLAICAQHEVDHLDGKLFVDYLSSVQRAAIRRKLLKDRRDRAA